MRGHLASARRGIVGRAHRLQELFVGRIAERKAQPAVAVIGIKPVVAGTQQNSRRHQQRFMPRARDLEEDLLLALEHDLPVVDPARLVHQPVDLDQVLGG